MPVEKVIEARDGVVIVQHWCDGELLYSSRESRDLPTEPGSRFRALPREDVVAALDDLIDLHVALEDAGWVSGDLYDGCLMYDFSLVAEATIDEPARLPSTVAAFQVAWRTTVR